jgi:hypothetical protein
MIARVGGRQTSSEAGSWKTYFYLNSVSPRGAATIIALNAIPKKTIFGFDGKTISNAFGFWQTPCFCRLGQFGRFSRNQL